MIAYKKVIRDFKEFVLTLDIPKQAQRGLSSRGMLRVSEAFVVRAECLNGQETPHKQFYSMYDWDFIYRVGETAKTELTEKGGIHCTPIKEQARNFGP